jgi:hypothetical protein
MLAARIRQTALEVVREEIDRCPSGINHENRIKNLEKDVDSMKCEITKGFDSLEEKLQTLFDSRYNDAKEKAGEAKEEHKDVAEKHRWTVEQILLAVFSVSTLIVSIILR